MSAHKSRYLNFLNGRPHTSGIFVYFRPFLVTSSIIQIESIDGVLGIQTRGGRMLGAYETTEL